MQKYANKRFETSSRVSNDPLSKLFINFPWIFALVQPHYTTDFAHYDTRALEISQIPVDTVALIIHYVRHDVLRVMRSTKWHAFMIYAVPVWIRRQPTFWWLVIKARHKRATERNVRTIARFASCLVGWILPLWRIAWHWNDGIRKRATTRGALRTTSQWKKPCHGSSSSFVPIKLTSSLFKSDKNGERAFTCIFETESGTIPLWIPSCLSSVDN